MIFHDGLKQLWTKLAQAYMKVSGNENRLLRILPGIYDDPVKKVHKTYHGTLVGESPEICRALDSHGFVDLDCVCALYCALVSLLD
jgi:hypothetical protein